MARRAHRRNACTAAVLAALAGGAACAQEVTFGGSNTVRWERYDTRGNAAFSPYSTDVTTGYDELNLNLGWKPSPYDKWQAMIGAVLNDSPYRSSERGLVPERFAITRENGESAIPYRVEAGDFYAFTTYRTQQRPLKGVSVDLQPESGNGGPPTQSIVAYAGAFQSSWKDLRWSDDNSIGLSWLSMVRGANVNVNLLRNERNPAIEGGSGRRTQQVGSIAADAPFNVGAFPWRWEAELAGLRGDHEDLGNGDDGRDKRAMGAFLQVSGNDPSGTLRWRLRGERYEEDYRPFGAVITPGRRSGEAYLSWTAPRALNLALRAQDFRDAYQSSNPLDTRLYGANLTGPVSPGATLYADAYRQTLARADGTTDQRTLFGTASLSMPMRDWLAQLGATVQKRDDDVDPSSDARTTELSATITRALRFGGWQGNVSPGLVWRHISGSSAATRDVRVTLALSATNGPHRIALNAGRLHQDPATVAPDVATVDFAVEYHYRFARRHEIAIDYIAFSRRPQDGESTRAYRAGLQWTMYFDEPPAWFGARAAAAPLAGAAPATLARDLGVVAAIAPGADLDATLARLVDAGFGTGARQGNAIVYEAPLIREVDSRQRLVIVHEAGRVERVAILVALSETGAAADAPRTYERVLRAMADRFGRPAVAYEEGAFGPAFANDVAMGRLLRSAQWSMDDGSVLRMGIPRRLDGVARIEIQHARGLGSPRDPAWSVETVR